VLQKFFFYMLWLPSEFLVFNFSTDVALAELCYKWPATLPKNLLVVCNFLVLDWNFISHWGLVIVLSLLHVSIVYCLLIRHCAPLALLFWGCTERDWRKGDNHCCTAKQQTTLFLWNQQTWDCSSSSDLMLVTAFSTVFIFFAHLYFISLAACFPKVFLLAYI
jgi:hypothetical protein